MLFKQFKLLNRFLQQGKIDDFTGSELEDCDNYSLSQVIVVLVIKQTLIRAGIKSKRISNHKGLK